MTRLDRITLEPGKRGGRPCVRGMRIAVEDVLGWLASGQSYEEILSDFPELTRDDIFACLEFAARREHVVVAAVRECDEETGYTAVLGAPLPSQSYSVMSRPKVVNYWCATVGAEVGFAPDDEVDEAEVVYWGRCPACRTAFRAAPGVSPS